MQRINRIPAGTVLGRIAKRLSSAPSASDRLRVARALWPYVWPAHRPDLQATVVVSLALMLVAKFVTVAMPFTYKWATAARSPTAGGSVPPSQTFPWLLGAPLLATLLYALSRIPMTLLVQIREGMFA